MAAALPLDHHLCFSVYATNMAIGRLYKPLLDQLGITYPQYLVLQALWETDGRTVGEIADRLTLESSTVTPLLKRLEAAGHVVRTRNPADERQVQVRLTDKGRAMREDCGCLGETLFARSGGTLEELTDLHGRLEKLRAAVTGEGA